ncbi:hypothetical protein D3C83_302610 [compost metagenome]
MAYVADHHDEIRIFHTDRQHRIGELRADRLHDLRRFGWFRDDVHGRAALMMANSSEFGIR